MIHDIHINPVLNGFVVHVGCQSVVVSSIDDLQKEIGRYYRNPAAVEKEYRANAVNNMFNNAPQPDMSSGTDVQCEAPITRNPVERR